MHHTRNFPLRVAALLIGFVIAQSTALAGWDRYGYRYAAPVYNYGYRYAAPVYDYGYDRAYYVSEPPAVYVYYPPYAVAPPALYPPAIIYIYPAPPSFGYGGPPYGAHPHYAPRSRRDLQVRW